MAQSDIHQERVFRKANHSDFGEVLQLQRENLITNLGEEGPAGGFLSIEYTADELAAINQELGVFVAFEKEHLLGYLMTQTLEFAAGAPVIAQMLSRLGNLELEGRPLGDSRLFIYGPVCIDKNFRGQGVLEGLFGIMRETLIGSFDRGLAFISKANRRSFHAHERKLGMSVVDEFEFRGSGFWTLAFSLPWSPQQL